MRRVMALVVLVALISLLTITPHAKAVNVCYYVNMRVGPYQIVIYTDTHWIYVKNCFARRYCNHLNVKVYYIYPNYSKQILDRHIAVWKEAGSKLCLAKWDELTGYCSLTCTATKEQVEQAWVEAAASVAITVAAVKAVASIISQLSKAMLVI